MTNAHDVLWHDVARVAEKHARRLRVDTDDLAQSLAVALLSQRSRPTTPAPWLERVARNLAVSSWRRQRREQALVVPDREEACPSETPLPCDRLAAAEESRLLARAYRDLPAHERALLDQRFGTAGQDEQGGTSERGARTPWTATERTRLRRLLLRLRAELGALRAWFGPGTWSAGAQSWALAGWAAPVALATVMGTVAGVPLREAATAHAPMTSSARGVRPSATCPANGSVTPQGDEHGRHLLRVAREGDERPARVLLAAERGASPRAGSPRAAGAGNPSRATSTSPGPTQRFDYEEDVVDGTLFHPDGILLQGESATKRESLIELRRDFVPELLKGLEDLG